MVRQVDAGLCGHLYEVAAGVHLVPQVVLRCKPPQAPQVPPVTGQ